MLSVCAESKLVDEAMGLLQIMRKDGSFPIMDAFNKLMNSLVSTQKFSEGLELFYEVLDSGIRVDKFAYGKAVQCAVKLGDLERGLKLLELMRRRVGVNVFVYNLSLIHI